MRIVLRYDSKMNAWALAPDECEGVPAGVLSAKSYCETAGFLPSRMMIELPSVVCPCPEKQSMDSAGTMLAAKADEQEALIDEQKALIDELRTRLKAYEPTSLETTDEGNPAQGGEGSDK